jgi:hypothetical protein
MNYYQFVSFEMVTPNQVEALRKSQDGVVGWRYLAEKNILDLLFDTDVKNEAERIAAINSGTSVYAVPSAQRDNFHLPTRSSILNEIADVVESLLDDAIGVEEVFNPSEYIVSSDYILKLQSLLEKLGKFEEDNLL